MKSRDSVDNVSNKATKETRIATIVGQRIVYVVVAPFCDEKTKRRAVLKGNSEGEVTARSNARSNTLS